MGFLELLRGSADGASATLYERRNCGHGLSAAADGCPRCGSDEIASYAF